MSSTSNRHRRALVFRGDRAETRHRAGELLAGESGEFLWVSDRAAEIPGVEHVEPRRTADVLGRGFDAVVVDVHEDFDADVIGRVHGLVRGGGTLVLRLPDSGEEPSELRDGRAARPYGPADVEPRLWERFVDLVGMHDAITEEPSAFRTSDTGASDGTSDQREAVDALGELLEAPTPARAALLADRGRGKSAALGLAIRRHRERDGESRVVVTARRRDATRELYRFAVDEGRSNADRGPEFIEPADLLAGESAVDALFVDEAAQLPVSVLQRLVTRYPDADLVFATTTHGYEGTGRGFAIRFLEWLGERDEGLEVLELDEPIRWAPDDPLEDFAFRALLLDAEPAARPAPVPDLADLRHVRLDRDRLAGDEEMLRETLGLLVRAHYRTRPRDLQEMLAGPNLSLHALLDAGTVVAATWVAREGNLPADVRDAIFRGDRRIRGHALPEIFSTKLGYRNAPRLEMIRHVRTAVHPDLQRRGLGSRLIEAVHDFYDPDLFGTVFSATPGVVDFRRSVGHEIVRLGTARGRRTGAPSVTMIRPVSEPAEQLFESLRADLARKLPTQLELADAGRPLPIDPNLRTRLNADLPPAVEPPQTILDHHVAHYAFGPRTSDSAADSVERFVRRHRAALSELSHEYRALIEARVLDHRGWRATADAAGLESVRAAMRALRRAVRELVSTTESTLVPP